MRREQEGAGEEKREPIQIRREQKKGEMRTDEIGEGKQR